MKSKAVRQFTYAAVKQRSVGQGLVLEYVYDIWTWNVWKLKWTRMSQHGSGWSSSDDAAVGAVLESDKIAVMLEKNREPPAPIN